ncbi:MAG: hypothetical protein P8M25_02695 [Paracoccaceae bacterium]|nr:hypothetical protein [Paracoccaceae bacterium]
MSSEILVTVHASAPRRLFGVSLNILLGLLLIYIAVVKPPEHLGWQGFLIVLGAGVLWLAQKMWQATELILELTETELRDSGGVVISKLDQIVSIDRGMLAFKPSNGFILKVDEAQHKAWRPGLWWRIGRQVGVGGVTSGGNTKMMADIIAAKIAEREPRD